MEKAHILNGYARGLKVRYYLWISKYINDFVITDLPCAGGHKTHKYSHKEAKKVYVRREEIEVYNVLNKCC